MGLRGIDRAGQRILSAARPAAALAVAAALAAAPPAAAQEGAGGGGRITYEDVLRAPGDLALNFAYANQQIEDGDLPAAASTLERLLILEPAANQVRLLYGIVLYRLGQTAEAEAEFAAIDPDALAAADRATLERFEGLAARSRRATTGSLGVTGGLQYDTNRNAFPLGGNFQVELPGGSVILPGAGDENADLGQFLLVDGRVDHDLGLQRIRRVSVTGTALGVNQVEESRLDVASVLGGASVLIDAEVIDLEPAVTILNVNLGGEQYLTATEGRLGFGRAIGRNDRIRLFGAVSGGYEDFSGVDADPFAGEQDGAFVRAEIGLSYTPLDRLRITGRYRYTHAEAEFDFEAFDAHGLRLGAQYVLANGVSLVASGGYTNQSFDAPDPFVSQTIAQDDDILDAGLGVVVSAGTLLDLAGVEGTGALADNLVLNVGGRYRRVLSNLPNFEYDNFRMEVSITKRFYF